MQNQLITYERFLDLKKSIDLIMEYNGIVEYNVFIDNDIIIIVLSEKHKKIYDELISISDKIKIWFENIN